MTNAKKVEPLKRSGVPAYLQIAEALREMIQKGVLEPEDSLPSTAQLCDQYGVSASVVKAAISVLRTEGLVVGQQGKGVFVRPAGQGSQPDDDALVAQLDEIQSAIRDLSGRMAAIEEAVFPKRARTARRDT
ncbi:winged helix-turn-helix domain-containing protein [Streptomyces fractus]|uniref:winged helix-turn-helix domain-containing protein n=1 Tax=Streptomyces fractus TaxID=641806 RepID=UPI003CEEB5CB